MTNDLVFSNEASKILGWTTVASRQFKEAFISVLCSSNLPTAECCGLSHSPWIWGNFLTRASWRAGREEFQQPVLLASPVPMCRKLHFVTAEAELLTELQEGTPIAGTANGREQSVHPLSFYTLKNIPVQQAEWMNPPAAHSARETNGKTKAASKTGVAEQKEIELAAPQHSGRVLERAKKSTIIGPLS